MPRKNILLFRWKNREELLATIARWKERFAEKHGEFNISEIRKELITSDTLTDCMTMWFMGGSRLMIFHDILIKDSREIKKMLQEMAQESEWGEQSVFEGEKREQKDLTAEEWIQMFEKMPESNFLIFIWNTLPVTPLEKWLEKNATIHEFPELEWQSVVEFIKNTLRLPTSQAEWIAMKLNYRHSLAIQETKKLLLAHQPKWEDDELDGIIPDYQEENIFNILDLLWKKNPQDIEITWKRIAERPDYERHVASMMTIIRKILIALYFPNATSLPITPFQRNTARRLMANKKNLTRLYGDLVQTDIWSKSWVIPERKHAILISLIHYCYDYETHYPNRAR